MIKKWFNRNKSIFNSICCILLVLIVTNSNEPTGNETMDDGLDSMIPDIVPVTILSSNERVVNNYAELKDALSNDNGVTTVYFGNDITMQTTGVRIHPNKINVVIDGFNPLDPDQNQPYTLTDYSSATFTDTIYINAAGPKTLLVRDLTITGKNYYGPISALDSATLSSLVITYERVSYNGPQIGYHRYGLIRFIDCSVSIHGRNGGSPNQEFSEAKYLIFEGKNTIDTATSNYSIFWHPVGGTFKISNDSSLTLISANTSGTYGVFYADGSAYRVDIDIGEWAVLDMTISGVVAPTGNVTLSSLTVQEGGSFYLRTTKAVTEAILAMGGNLTVNTKATFIINGYGSAAYTAIAQRTGDIIINKDATFHIIASGSRLINLYGRALICNDPLSVLLYNTSRDIEATTTAGRVYVDAQQINYWETVSEGGLDNPPLYGWKKADGSNFLIDGTLATGSGGNFSSLSSNYASGDLPETVPSAGTFSMVKARVLAFGRLELIVTIPTEKSEKITGVTAPGAIVRVSFSQQGINHTLPDVTADSEGVFSVNTGVPLEALTVITVKSSYQYLTSAANVTVSKKGTLEITVPDRIVFIDTKLTPDLKLAKRLDPDWHIVVSDTRGTGSEWSLYAQLIQPLTASDDTKPVLIDALVFVTNSITPLTSHRLLIYHHVSSSDDDVSKINWPAERGILIQAPINMTYSGLAYTAKIEWTLIDAP